MADCCHVCCKYECRGRNVGYSYLAPERFSMFMWRLPTIVYLCYRIIVALYAIVWFFMMVITFRYNGDDAFASRYEVSLIQMTFTATTLYVVSHAVLVVVMCLRLGNFRTPFQLPSSDQHISKFKNTHKDFNDFDEEAMNRQSQEVNQRTNNQNEISNYIQQSSQNSEINNIPSSADETFRGSASIYGWLSWYFQVVGILFHISCNVSVFIFIWYLRGALYMATPWYTHHTDNTHDGSIYLQVTGMGFVIAVFEAFTSAIPTRLLHFFYAQVLYIVYLIVYLSQSLTCIDDESTFPISISFVLMIILCPLPIHLILFGMYHLRCWILKKLYKGQAYYF